MNLTTFHINSRFIAAVFLSTSVAVAAGPISRICAEQTAALSGLQPIDPATAVPIIIELAETRGNLQGLPEGRGGAKHPDGSIVAYVSKGKIYGKSDAVAGLLDLRNAVLRDATPGLGGPELSLATLTDAKSIDAFLSAAERGVPVQVAKEGIIPDRTREPGLVKLGPGLFNVSKSWLLLGNGAGLTMLAGLENADRILQHFVPFGFDRPWFPLLEGTVLMLKIGALSNAFILANNYLLASRTRIHYFQEGIDRMRTALRDPSGNGLVYTKLPYQKEDGTTATLEMVFEGQGPGVEPRLRIFQR